MENAYVVSDMVHEATTEGLVLDRRDYVRGDANGDGNGVDLSDAVYILQIVFAGGPPILCEEAGETNDDEPVKVARAIYILHCLLADGPGFPAPNPQCGLDAMGPGTGASDLQPCDYPVDTCP